MSQLGELLDEDWESMDTSVDEVVDLVLEVEEEEDSELVEESAELM